MKTREVTKSQSRSSNAEKNNVYWSVYFYPSPYKFSNLDTNGKQFKKKIAFRDS